MTKGTVRQAWSYFLRSMRRSLEMAHMAREQSGTRSKKKSASAPVKRKTATKVSSPRSKSASTPPLSAMFSPRDVLAAQVATGIRHTALVNRDRKLPGGLGRFAAVDPRDKRHPLQLLLPRKRVALTSKTWRHATPLDQGQTSRCVAFAWASFLGAVPIQTKKGVRDDAYLNATYKQAQALDEWPGDQYNGTSVRAGAKALQQQGHIAEYLWGTTVDELRQFVLTRGTVVVGSDWYEEMFFPEHHDGHLVHEGAVAGGHAWLVIGYNASKKAFVMMNSWGKNWGKDGTALVSEDVMNNLLGAGAEMCSAVECKVAKK